jgi:Mg2+ transporter MgtE
VPWLTELLGTAVVGPTGESLGRVREVAASRGRFPTVVGVTVSPDRAGRRSGGSGGGRFIPWEALKPEGREKPQRLELAQRTGEEGAGGRAGNGRLVADPASADLLGPRGDGWSPEIQLQLRAELLDRQIVDIDGARVVRVNDVWLAESAGGLRVVGADVGMRGVLRRLGLERILSRVAGALGYELPDRLIAWNYVAPLEEDSPQGPKGPKASHDLRLTVPTHLLRELHPSELADILDQLDTERRERILRVLTDAALAETLAETEPEVSSEALEALGEERARRVVEIMRPDEAADVLGSIGYERAERLLSLMGVKQASILRELLGYPPDTAGGRMTPSFVGIASGSTVQEAIDQIRREAAGVETIYYSYVLDGSGGLMGVLSLRQLLRANPSRRVEEIMERDVVSVSVEDDQERVARRMSRYDLLALPVVDEGGRLRGIVTVDDAVDVIEEEASEDLSEVTGVYLGEGPGVRSGRLAGFGISLFAGTVAAVLLDARRAVLTSVAALAWLLPLYLRMAQDLGTWSLARALSATMPDRRRRLAETMQEVLAALTSAAWSALLVGGVAAWRTGSLLAGVYLAVAIFVGCMAAALIGLAVPALVRPIRRQRLLVRGRPLAVMVGLASLLVYVWALGSLASHLR